MESKKIRSEHHCGRMVDLWVVLSDLASQENCDGEPYDQMQEASEYIQELEQKINDLETELEPYIEMEKNLYEKIQKMDKEQKKTGNRNVQKI